MKQLTRTLALGLAALAFTACSTLPLESDKDNAATTCHGAATSGWKAWGNVQPGSSQSLHVIGQVTTPTGGWQVALQERTPQGFNPAILILDLAVTPPAADANVSQGIEVHKPRHEKKGAARKHTTVEIRCREGDKDKVLATLEVELVQ